MGTDSDMRPRRVSANPLREVKIARTRRLAFAMLPPVTRDFTWRDGERIVRFGRGALAEAPDLLGDGYVLLTTPRAAASAPAVVAGAAAVHHVPAGRVDEVAGDLNEAVAGDLFVALGGGRVVDVAKALAAAHGAGAAAIPTTLSAAEMTRGHRHARGVDPAHGARAPAGRAQRPRPERLAAQRRPGGLGRQRARPRDRGHADAGARPCPCSRPARRRACSRARTTATRSPSARCCRATSSTPPATACTTCSPRPSRASPACGTATRTPRCCRTRPSPCASARPGALAALDAAAGVEMEALARRLAHHAGAQQLHDLGVDEATLERCVAEVLERSGDLAGTPPAAGEAEIRALYEAAY